MGESKNAENLQLKGKRRKGLEEGQSLRGCCLRCFNGRRIVRTAIRRRHQLISQAANWCQDSPAGDTS